MLINYTGKSSFIFKEFYAVIQGNADGIEFRNMRTELSSDDNKKRQRLLVRGEAVNLSTGESIRISVWPRKAVGPKEAGKVIGKKVSDFKFRIGKMAEADGWGSPKWLTLQFEDGTLFETEDLENDEFVEAE